MTVSLFPQNIYDFLSINTNDTAPSTPNRGLKLFGYNNGGNETTPTASVPIDFLLTGDDPYTGPALSNPGQAGLHYIKHFHSALYWNGTTTYRRFSFFRSYVITYSAAGVPTVTTVVTNADGPDSYGAYTARSYHSDYASDTTNFPVSRANISVVAGEVYLRIYNSTSPAVNSQVWHTALLQINTVI